MIGAGAAIGILIVLLLAVGMAGFAHLALSVVRDLQRPR